MQLEKETEGFTRPDLFNDVQFQKELKERENSVARELEQSWRHSSFSGVVLKNEKMKLDVFVCSPVLIDHTVFALWLEGYSGNKSLRLLADEFKQKTQLRKGK